MRRKSVPKGLKWAYQRPFSRKGLKLGRKASTFLRPHLD